MAASNTYIIWPIAVYGGLVVVLILGMIMLSYLLGQRHSTRIRNQPYESGIQPTGSARVRYGASYYLVALFFILFDVEAAFVFAWAAAFRELGWAGYVVMSLFIVTLAFGLVYVWRLGGLDYYSSYSPGREDD